MKFEKTSWRLVITTPAKGAWNMALDEAILEAAGRGDVPPTLRLYAWEPACLSLGYAQPFTDVDLDSLQSNGWDLVRRPTGGRAILHVDELTYSVSGPPSEARLAGSVLESYRVISQALLQALHFLDIPAEAKEKPDSVPTSNQVKGGVPEFNPVCFEVPSNYEITVVGKKLIGSAQARRKEGVLQHGSLPLFGDLARVTQALVFENHIVREKAKLRLYDRAATVEGVLGHAPSWLDAAVAFIRAFENCLNLDLKPDEITRAELIRAEHLVKEKFDNHQWTQRV
ncbi:MAG TPA: biotin/lipoate A/B protein ligase family protein [Anaerolineales bacterium]|nr:biotin/lipoate A/B protein ligase family protein [Anaerolineales bacterium]